MNSEKIILKCTLTGILGELIKKIVVFILVLAGCIITNDIRSSLLKKHGSTLFSLDASKFGALIVTILAHILFIALIIAAIIIFFKIIGLLYELNTVTTIDFAREKIIVEKTLFPFSKEVDENKFNEIIEVGICQKGFDRLVNSGAVYVEYLAYNRVDSKMRSIYIPYIEKPYEKKQIIF